MIPGAGANGRPYFVKFGVNTNRRFFIPMANQRYDALQTNLTKRFSHGVFLTSSFTWSKALGWNGGNSDNGLSFYVPSQFSKNRSVAGFDRTLAWTSAANWELPFGKAKKLATGGVAAAIVGGWQINPTVSLYTGTPFTVTADGSSLNAPQNTQVADQVNSNVQQFGGVGLGAPFYDPSAFAPVRDVRFGNTGQNILRGPRLFDMNMGLFRRFNLTERATLQFRAEALNLTNTPALNNPNSSVSTPSNFMMITSTISTVTSAQRTIRFGLRMGF